MCTSHPYLSTARASRTGSNLWSLMSHMVCDYGYEFENTTAATHMLSVVQDCKAYSFLA
jgi:hypothetical protein